MGSGFLRDRLRAGRLRSGTRRVEPILTAASASWMVWRVCLSGLLFGARLVKRAGSPMSELDRIRRATAEQRVLRLGLGSGTASHRLPSARPRRGCGMLNRFAASPWPKWTSLARMFYARAGSTLACERPMICPVSYRRRFSDRRSRVR
jgi:hypothetical protein